MLAPEAAKKQLEQWQVEVPKESYVAEFGRIPKALLPFARHLLGCDADGKNLEWEQRREQIATWEPHLLTLDQAPRPDRLKALGVFFGTLAEPVDAALRFLQRAPYTLSSTRRAFRAPGRADVTADSRFTWLDRLFLTVRRFRADVVTPAWLAAWAPHLESSYGREQEAVGRFLAAVIDAGGPDADAVFDTLCQSARNEHEVGAMGRHVTRGLLLASRPEGWELMERMLLAAQRQEGLRQSILETVDEAHPDAFRRMLRVIRENDLVRFSAVVRAADVWFGLGWDSASVKTVNETLARIEVFLCDDVARGEALQGDNAEAAYLALWAIAFEDAPASIPVAVKLLKRPEAEFRFVATVHLRNLGLDEARVACWPALDDADLRVALSGLNNAVERRGDLATARDDYFEALERLYQRLPEKPKLLEPLVWPWTARQARRDEVAGHLVMALGSRPPTRLLPYLPAFASWHRRHVIGLLAAQKKWDALTRSALLDLAGNSSADVRGAAFDALKKTKLKAGEAERLEGYLTRKTSDLRRGAIELLLEQADPAALASADRLLAARDAHQRLAGLELLRHLAEARRQQAACLTRGDAYQSERKRLSQEEQTQLTSLRAAGREQVTLANALGLMDPAERSPAVPPKRRNVTFVSDAAVRCLESLDQRVHEHREAPIQVTTWAGPKQELLGNAGTDFPAPPWQAHPQKRVDELPLREVWEKWYAERPRALRDWDGLDLLRARTWYSTADLWKWKAWDRWLKGAADWKAAAETLSGGQARVRLRYGPIVGEILNWLFFLHRPEGVCDFLLDAVETSLTLVPPEAMKQLEGPPPERKAYYYVSADEETDWRRLAVFALWQEALEFHAREDRFPLTPAQAIRRWQLLHWQDEPFPGAQRKRPSLDVLLDAYAAGGATRADLLDALLGPQQAHGYRHAFTDLGHLTQRKLSKEHAAFLGRFPEVHELLDRCRERILEIELARGEAETPATEAALSLGALAGTDTLLRVLAALGKERFKREASWRSERRVGRAATLTHLAAVTFPRPADTPEAFAEQVRAALAAGSFPEERVLELAFLAPQWARFIEQYLGWPGFNEGLYWFLAHMHYVWGLTENVDAEPAPAPAEEGGKEMSAWDRLIQERTPLSDAERREGAIDVAWFQRTFAQLTPKRWQALADAARFAANAAQARRAQFIADVLRGKAKRRELVAGVRTKKLKESVRLLGLLPLAAGTKRDADLMERYRVLQEYRRYAKQLSAMTKDGALRAVEIGLHNLARTAGYPDPLRLEWALEAESVQDLTRGPVTVRKGDVAVTLTLDDQARPQVRACRGDKELKSVPADVKKDKQVAALLERAADLKRQSPRMRQSLETAMCRGDTFTGAELAQLCGHAVLAPLLERLVLVGDGIAGYPDKKGRALRHHRGKLEPVKKSEQLRLAHPHDLLESGGWDRWQRECFQAERVQPFKQVFRELYVVTQQERADGAESRRYAGQQINPSQAYALWGQRGWSTKEGVWKTFHDLGLTATVGFNHGITTPLEVEGLTLDTVRFFRRDQCEPVPLAEVPPRVFSEVMRDLDLVVSVAHRGGVDPEASASTVEMRAGLLRETCELLGMQNVRIQTNHALIDGQLAHYSVHLGSGTVHRLPGGALCIVPVHAQHRGRLFLPFADDDPRTAEVVSKVLLLARDQEIQDPTILDQLRR